MYEVMYALVDYSAKPHENSDVPKDNHHDGPAAIGVFAEYTLPEDADHRDEPKMTSDRVLIYAPLITHSRRGVTGVSHHCHGTYKADHFEKTPGAPL